MTEDDIQVKKPLTFSATPTVLKADVTEEGITLYYVISNKLMKKVITDVNALSTENQPVEINMSGAEINATWLAPAFVNGCVYYIDNTYSYTFFMNLDDFKFEPNDVKLLEGKIASGYEKSDKTEDGTIPKFMTDTDKETYITNNPKEEE